VIINSPASDGVHEKVLPEKYASEGNLSA